MIRVVFTDEATQAHRFELANAAEGASTIIPKSARVSPAAEQKCLASPQGIFIQPCRWMVVVDQWRWTVRVNR
jgi:hypothetical protein